MLGDLEKENEEIFTLIFFYTGHGIIVNNEHYTSLVGKKFYHG